MRAVRAVRGVWHRQRNPLRRRTDRIEAWVGVAAALLILLGAPSAGWFVGRAAHDVLLETVRAQLQQRHQVWVTVDRPVSRTPLDPDPETASHRDARLRVIGRWTGADGTAHTGRIAAPRPVEPGERFRIWTDDRGRVVPRPMDAGAAGTHAALAGLGTAVAAVGLVEGGRRLVVGHLMVRRFRDWDLAWERAGQDWGRADAN